MAVIKPFRALRAAPHLYTQVACVPYDVINSEEARKLADGNPASLLHVTRSEIDLPPGTDPYSDAVYTKAAENLKKFMEEGTLVQDPAKWYYVYSLKRGNQIQTGVVAVASVDEYDGGLIKKHEKTRKDKEDDRTRHLFTLSAHIEPVFLCYRRETAIDTLVNKVKAREPVNHYTAADGVEHWLWNVDRPTEIDALEKAFDKVPALYVADGHHRSASASRARAVLRDKNPDHYGIEPYNFFLSVIFPDGDLAILPYNRVVKDLNGRTPESFLQEIGAKFEVTREEKPAPDRPATFALYLKGEWYTLTAKPGTYDACHPVNSLDVSILQDNLLAPILGIADPRTDKRIDFVGGIRGTGELVRLVDSGKAVAAFSLFPTTIKQLMDISDAGEIMPPKSTWFEPKLRSGLFIHLF